MVRKISVSEEVWAEIAKRGKFGDTEDSVLRQVFGLKEIVSKGGQTKETGARASKWGRETADKIASSLGADKTNPRANEYRLDGKDITIRCARFTTNSVGVTKKMLERVDTVMAALETESGEFELYSLSPSAYANAMRDTRSKGPSAGRVGIVPTRIFRNQGNFLKILTID